MILGEKEFKKPILDELGQNWTNIENQRRNLDQRVESWKNLEENPWMMSILEDLGEFNGFGPYLNKERRRKSFEHLGEFSKINILDLQGVFGP